MPESSYAPEPSNRNISIAAARRMLGMIGRNYDDAEVQEILDGLYTIAEEGYEIYRQDDGATGLDHSER